MVLTTAVRPLSINPLHTEDTRFVAAMCVCTLEWFGFKFNYEHHPHCLSFERFHDDAQLSLSYSPYTANHDLT